MVQAISMVLVPTVMDGWVRCVPVTVRAGWLTQLVAGGVFGTGGSSVEDIGAS